jgi:hypothetical protein
MQWLIEKRIGELNAKLMELVTNPQGPVAGQVYQLQGEIAGLEWVLNQEVSLAA